MAIRTRFGGLFPCHSTNIPSHRPGDSCCFRASFSCVSLRRHLDRTEASTSVQPRTRPSMHPRLHLACSQPTPAVPTSRPFQTQKYCSKLKKDDRRFVERATPRTSRNERQTATSSSMKHPCTYVVRSQVTQVRGRSVSVFAGRFVAGIVPHQRILLLGR